MKRPLKTALADALHLCDHEVPPQCPSEQCALRQEHDERVPDRAAVDRREADGHGQGMGHRMDYRSAADPPGEDTLFLFLKSLHQFLTAPQDPVAHAAERADERARSAAARRDGKADGDHPR
ncbi:hypothetical protein ACWEV4_29390 [Streptomyces sp. NPDC003860]